MSRHAQAMDAVAYWRQFVTNFYFDTAGDKVSGTVLELITGRHGDPPAIKLQTAGGRVFIVTGRQARLAFELVKAAPAVGDDVTIRFDGEASKAAPGMNKAKEFTVTVVRKGSQPGAGTETGARGSEDSDNEPRAGNKVP